MKKYMTEIRLNILAWPNNTGIKFLFVIYFGRTYGEKRIIRYYIK